MSKKLAKLREKITAALEGVEDEIALAGILNYAELAGGSTGEVAEEDEGDKKKKKKDKEEESSDEGVDLSGLKKKQLKAVAEAAGIENAADLDADDLRSALGELSEKKLTKALGKAGVEV